MSAPAENSAVHVLESHRLRSAYGTFATGVTIMTVGGDLPHGMTANSFASVSLEPPLVLLCVANETAMYDRLDDDDAFGVSVLAAHQEDVARHFANRHRRLGEAEFDGVDWVPGDVTGVPVISDALAAFECRVWRSHPAGDHTIVLGEVMAMYWQERHDALLFMGGEFRQPAARRVVQA
jgi:flavin reductase (DIM6/NTAB) family NADH-FMN oxidoreductase RutF